LVNKINFTICPSYLTPYLSANTDEVEKGLFLRKFGVPYWALAYVFGHDHSFWYRLETHCGRVSLLGITVRKTALPVDLLADEHFQYRDGEMNYIATTVGQGCCLGAAVSTSAGEKGLTVAYGEFHQEAIQMQADYSPETVNTDGWASTQLAWRKLFPQVIFLQCFLHAWLSIRQRGKHLKSVFFDLSKQIWDAYHSADKRCFSQRLRRLREWSQKNISGHVLNKVESLCQKRSLWLLAFDHPNGYRTSNMLDRVMRSMNRYFDQGLHLHGSLQAANRRARAWALLYNFSPWHPATTRINNGWQSPAERINQHRYHDNWLQNLLISASLGGEHHVPLNP
jgi:hypothetical protein